MFSTSLLWLFAAGSVSLISIAAAQDNDVAFVDDDPWDQILTETCDNESRMMEGWARCAASMTEKLKEPVDHCNLDSTRELDFSEEGIKRMLKKLCAEDKEDAAPFLDCIQCKPEFTELLVEIVSGEGEACSLLREIFEEKGWLEWLNGNEEE